MWLRPSRLVPLLTIFGAGLAVILSNYGLIETTVAENIVITLIALLAIDALIERINVLERLESTIGRISGEQQLKPRETIPTVESQAERATEICLFAVSAISVASRKATFFEQKLSSGCNLRVILLNPESPSLPAWELQNRFTTARSDIASTLATFKELSRVRAKGKCEVRLINIFAPFSMFATDLEKDTGNMVVEYYGYKTSNSERPHVYLTRRDSPLWFGYYALQFEQAWSEAVPINLSHSQ
jgi:hypothetical protein